MIEKETLKGLRPYMPGKPISDVKREYGLTRVVKLASNENPFGYSPKVKEVLIEGAADLNYYPDGGAVDLKEKIAEFHSIPSSRLLIGSGLDEVIQIVSRAILTAGDEIIIPDPSFPQYAHHAIIEGAKVVKVPVNSANGEMDLKQMLASITDKTRIIWLCNPNNPTGTYIEQARIKAFIQEVPKDVLVISDEAYQEYVTAEEVTTSFGLLKDFNNLMIMRTFSKAYGLAGLRIGYAIMPEELVYNLEVARLPFNSNSLAQKAAVVALEDQEFIEENVKVNREELEKWETYLADREIPYYVSQTNFIFFNVKKDSLEVAQELLGHGFIIRGGLQPEWVRVTIGHAEDNEKLREILSTLI